MTVHEVVKKMGLEDFSKRYFDYWNNPLPLPNLKALVDTEVLSLAVDFDDKSVCMKLYWY